LKVRGKWEQTTFHRIAVMFKLTPEEVEEIYLAEFGFLDKYRHTNPRDETRQPTIRILGLGVFANKEETYERNRERYRRKSGKYPDSLWTNLPKQGEDEGV